MVQGIAILGLNGGGKSTLAHELATRIGYYEMDVEDYYFPEQKASRRWSLEKDDIVQTECLGIIPFSKPRTKDEVEQAIALDMERHSNFIISGVTMNWNDEILSKLEVAFWIKAPLDIRLKRIQYREKKRFGNRVLLGGDMYEQQLMFRNVVRNRDEQKVEESVEKLRCPVIMLDGTDDIKENLDKIIGTINKLG